MAITCGLDFCFDKHRALGYCDAHYKRFRRFGFVIGPRWSPNQIICAVDCCEKRTDAKGLCSQHGGFDRRHGSPIGPFLRKRFALGCSVDGCNYRNAGGGLCSTHSKWAKKTGDPSIRPPQKKAERFAIKNKKSPYQFRVVHNHPFMGSGRFFEHRIIMSEHLGRALYLHENVHHVNGVKKDNRIENLELWTVYQPPGQRVVDKIAYAKQILATYEPEALKEGN